MSAAKTPGLDLADRQKIIERCLDDGARQIDGTIHFATSADQRAIVIASTYITAATALIAGLVAWASNATVPSDMLWGGIVAAVLFYLGAIICIWTAFPIITYAGGNPPNFWKYHIDQKTAYATAIESQISEYEEKIKLNALSLKKRAQLFRIGGIIGASAPLFGLIGYGLIRLCP